MQLHVKTKTGEDAFGAPLYADDIVDVDNVLVSPSSTDDVITSTNLVGKQAVYTLAIPKGDEHDWQNAKIDFFGKTWRSYGFTIQGIEANVPTAWHKKVMVELYE